jgi:preprotein translocase subunit SecG
MVFSLIYKNLLHPEDSESFLRKLADMFFPLFMFYSFLLVLFKKKSEGKAKLSDEDREAFQKVSHKR